MGILFPSTQITGAKSAFCIRVSSAMFAFRATFPCKKIKKDKKHLFSYYREILRDLKQRWRNKQSNRDMFTEVTLFERYAEPFELYELLNNRSHIWQQTEHIRGLLMKQVSHNRKKGKWEGHLIWMERKISLIPKLISSLFANFHKSFQCIKIWKFSYEYKMPTFKLSICKSQRICSWLFNLVYFLYKKEFTIIYYIFWASEI